MVKKRSGERGQGLVELAVMLPLLLMITMGAVDLGRVFFSYVTIVNAAREGAICASLPSCTDNWQAAVDQEIGTTLPGAVTRTLSCTVSGCASGDVTVTVQYNFDAVTTAIVSSGTLPISASATMVVQAS